MKKALPKIAKKLLPKTINNPGGFTLVELLVTISILAILAIIGFALFQDAQKRARDARRRAEVEAISNALEVNYSESSANYPTLGASAFSGGSVPTDPLNTASRCVSGAAPYTAGASCGYCVRTSPGNCAGDPIFPAYPGGASDVTSWSVCSNLEKPNGSSSPPEPSYFCKSNQR